MQIHGHAQTKLKHSPIEVNKRLGEQGELEQQFPHTSSFPTYKHLVHCQNYHEHMNIYNVIDHFPLDKGLSASSE